MAKTQDQKPKANQQLAIGNRQCSYGCIFCIVTVTIGVAPPVLLYEIQHPTFGYRTSLYLEPSGFVSISAPNTCCGVITPVAPFMKSTEIAVTLCVALSYRIWAVSFSPKT